MPCRDVPAAGGKVEIVIDNAWNIVVKVRIEKYPKTAFPAVGLRTIQNGGSPRGVGYADNCRILDNLLIRRETDFHLGLFAEVFVSVGVDGDRAEDEMPCHLHGQFSRKISPAKTIPCAVVPPADLDLP